MNVLYEGATTGSTTETDEHRALVAAARDMIPRLRERAQACEEARKIPDSTINELADVGIFKMLRPARFGGLELDYGSIQLDVARELGRGCGSTAWVAVVVACHDWIVGMYPEEAQQEIWDGSPETRIVSAFAWERSETTIETVDGGYILSGRWKFASGCDHCDWAILGGMAPSGDGPPENVWFIVGEDDWRVDDTWYSPGLAGTGSKDILVDRAIVPSHRAVPTALLRQGAASPGGAVNQSYNFQLPLAAVFPFNIGAPAIGIARGMLETYAETASERLAASAGQKMCEFPSVQLRTSESAVEIDCADLLMQRTADDVRQTALGGNGFLPEKRFKWRRDLSYATLLCRRAVERLISTMGAHGLDRASVEQRAFRDLYAVTSQIALQWDVNAPGYAQILFDMEPTDKRI